MMTANLLIEFLTEELPLSHWKNWVTRLPHLLLQG